MTLWTLGLKERAGLKVDILSQDSIKTTTLQKLNISHKAYLSSSTPSLSTLKITCSRKNIHHNWA